MQHSKNINLIKRIGLILIGILLILYIIFQLFYSKFAGVKTDTVTEITSYDTYETNGLVIRNEIMVDDNIGGYAIYTVDDGYAIAGGASVADIYESQEDVVAENQIKSLESKKSDLEQLRNGSSTFERDLDKLNNQIYDEISGIESLTSGGSLYKMSTNLDDLTYMLNERQLVKGDVIDFSSKINDIDQQINELESTHSSAIGSINSPQAGYFISLPDGYENVVNYDDIKTMTVDELRSVQPQPVDDTAIGKIATDLNWYVVCEIPSDKSSLYRVDDVVDIEMPYSTNMTIPATVVAVNQTTKNDPAALVLECDYMNSDIAKARNEKIEINSNEYTGLKVSKDAIHIQEVTKQSVDENGQVHKDTQEVQGVYVLYGNQLVFKQIVPLYAYSNYVICDDEPDEEELYTDGTVQVYDKVVTGGTNLYDGKLIS